MPTGSDTPPRARTDARVRARLSSRAAWLRLSVASLAAAAAALAIGLMAYRLALARVPQYRATLEHLVHARTGLEVVFNELGLRWGWYGPEAVFREVELGEPGRASVLRARELIVGLDAWRSMQSGQIEAGRITLVAPDIDVAQLAGDHPGARARTPGAPAGRYGPLLERWPNGRIDVEGGTLSWPDPRAPTSRLRLAIGRAELRRSDKLWSAAVQLFPPDALGRSVRVSLEIAGDPRDEQSLRAALRLHGRDLALARWGEILDAATSKVHWRPSAGTGSLAVQLDWKGSRLSGASGELSSENVTVGSGLRLGSVSGAWKLARTTGGWRFSADRLRLGPSGVEAVPSSAVIDFGEDGSWVQGEVLSAPLEILVSAAEWCAPDVDLAAARILHGTAPRIAFEWRSARPIGSRLQLSGTVDELELADAGAGFAVGGLRAQFAGTESDVIADVSGGDVHFTVTATPAHQLRGVRLAASVRFQRDQSGWQLATERTSIEHAQSRLQLRAGLRGARTGGVPAFALHATLTDGDVETLDVLLGTRFQMMLGPAAARLRSRRVARAEVDWEGPAARQPQAARTFKGALVLEDGELAPAGPWPAFHGVAGRLEWHGDDVRAAMDRASAGPFALSGLEAEWHSSKAGAARIAGRGEASVAEVLAWLRQHPDLNVFAAAARDIDARGRALYAFNATLPPGADENAQVRVVTRLEAGEIRFAPQLPPLQSVNGTLTFDSGHLMRSTLEGEWLGGATVLHLTERREKGMPALWLQAQGTIDARRLVAAAGPEMTLAPADLQVAGRSPWKGELTFAPQVGTWRARAESSLLGISSRLPAPLVKTEAVAMPVRLAIEGARETALLRLAVGESVHGLIELAPRSDGTWQPTSGGLRFGGGPPRFGREAELDLSGRLARVDLSPWLIAFRKLAASGRAAPLNVNLVVDDLVIAGVSCKTASLDAQARSDGALELRVESPELTGVARWPGGALPTEVQLDSLTLPHSTDPAELAIVVAALAPAARVSASAVVWQGRTLGSLAADVQSTTDGLVIEPLELSGASGDAHGAVRCAASSERCHARFELASRDAAVTLRDFGFRDDLSAQHAALEGELEWPLQLPPGRSWLASLTGRLSLALSEGSTLVPSDASGVPFPLLAVSALLHDSRASRAASDGASAAGRLGFTQLTADYELREGSAFTSNLHFDGDAEIVMTGRSGLAAGDYDYRAWILRGEDRLPSAVRRFAAAPHLAAAWLALRDLLSGPPEGRSRAELHLGGTRDAPLVDSNR
jgi:uncharacterized protein YhdP